MIVSVLSELSVVKLFEPGVPNKESLAISVNEPINMGQFGLMLGISSGEKEAVPIHDQLYWFGNGYVQKGDWIFLYTGSGTPRTTDHEDGTKSYTVFWGRPTTVFANSQVVPILFKAGAVSILDPPINKSQSLLESDTSQVTPK